MARQEPRSKEGGRDAPPGAPPWAEAAGGRRATARRAAARQGATGGRSPKRSEGPGEDRGEANPCARKAAHRAGSRLAPRFGRGMSESKRAPPPRMASQGRRSVGVRGRGPPPQSSTDSVACRTHARRTGRSDGDWGREPMRMQDRTAPGGRTPVSPAGGEWLSDSGPSKRKRVRSSRWPGLAIERQTRPPSKPLHDAVTPNRHGVMALYGGRLRTRKTTHVKSSG